jgi:uncharacterized protein YjdB
MRFTLLWSTVALLGVGAAGCGYSNGPTYPSNPVSVQGVIVTPQSVQLAAVGATRQLVATVAPTNATDKALTWESSNSAVATVDGNGLVTARAAGDGVFITVFTHDGHHQASVNVSVNP